MKIRNRPRPRRGGESAYARCRTVWLAVCWGGICAIVAAPCGARGGTSRSPARDPGWGIAVGMPYAVSVIREVPAIRELRFQFSAGTLLLISSVTARVLFVPTGGRVFAYGFAGTGMLHVAEGDGSGPVGRTGFGWFGAGVRARVHVLQIFLDTGILVGLDVQKGFDRNSPAGSLGVVFAR